MDYEASNRRELSDDNGLPADSSTAGLTPQVIAAAAAAGAIPLNAGADGVIVLPAGVELDDILVRGRDLVIQTDGGRTYVIVDGAIFVPTLVIDGVTVPPLNLAALLNGAEIQPAAGTTQSSGNNFSDPVGDIQDAYRLGDLLPYTEFGRGLETPEEIIPGLVDRDPDVLIEDGSPPSKNAEDSVSEAGLPGTRLNGNGEAPGSASAGDSEITTGRIILTSPDGIASVTINGTTINLAGGTSITTPLGRLDLGALVGEEIGYTYTLIDNLTDNSITDVFTVIVTDPDGDSSTATLTVSIVDDAPDAINDVDSVAAGSTGPATGNVITGSEVAVPEDGNATDGNADVQGADGARVSFIDNSQNAAPGVAVPAGGSVNIAGQYGTLTIYANGDYSYARAPGQGGGQSEVFTYTLLDGDTVGDTDTATLTISIGDSTPTISGLTPEADGGDTVVDEDDLPGGSDTIKESLTGTGDFTITSPDGVGSLVIGGHQVITNGVFTPDSWTTPLGNTISILTYNPATGVVTYSYTLGAAETHADADGENNLFENFAVSMTDLDGDPASSTLSVRIVDDVPTGVNDTDSVAAGSNGPATGNVLTGVEVAVAEDGNATDGIADVQGADGARVSFIDNSQNAAAGVAVPAGGSNTIAGLYGTLTIFANGDYSYARTPGTPGGNDEVFTYTLLDADGDTSTATLTIEIGNAPPVISGLTPEAQGGDVIVDEDDLPDGSDTTKESLTGNGDFTITSTDGILSLVIGGHQVITNGVFTADSWTTPLGNTISITGYNPATGVVNYTYTLTDNENHPNANGQNGLFEDFSVVLTDLDGEVANDTLTAQIVDDVPAGVNDIDSVAPGSADPATGNVLTGSEVAVAEDANGTDGNADVSGADGARVSFIDNSQNAAPGAVVADGGFTDIAGLYGTLRIWSNGDYSYARTPGIGGGQDEVFTYTLLDGDGDTATATLTISIGNSPPVITNLTPAAQGGDVSVDEDDLLDGSDPTKESLTGLGNFTITSPDGILSLVIGGHQVITNGVFTPDSWATPLGNTISILTYNPGTGVVTYSYTLGDNENHPNANGENALFEDFAVVLTDLDGQFDTDTLSARIVDDVPSATNDTDSVPAGTTDLATGNVITGAEVAVIEDANGTDGNADVQGADGARVSFIDNSQDGAAGAAVPDGGSVNINGQYGVLTIFSNGDYSYARNPGEGGGASEIFTYTLLDGDGDTDTATLTIDIGNAPPVIRGLNPAAQGGDVSVDEDDLLDGSDTAKESLTGNGDFTISSPDGVASLVIDGHQVITNGVFTADSWATPLGNTISILTYDFGTGVVTYSYTLGDNENHPNSNGENALFEDFAVVLTDLDGQMANDILSAQIVDDVPTATDDGVPTPYSVAENTPLVIDVLANDTTGADWVNDTVGMQSFTQPPVGEGTVTYNNDGTFTFTPPASGTFFGDTSFTYTIVDGDGDTSTATVHVNIARDSTPNILRVDTVIVDEDGFGNANDDNGQASPQEVDSNELLVNTGTIIINFGADVPANPLAFANMHLVDTAGLDTQLQTLDGNPVTFALVGGDLVGSGTGGEVIRIHLDSYILGPNPGDVSYTYEVTLTQPVKHPTVGTEDTEILSGVTFEGTDSDGSPFQGTLSVNIIDDVPSLSVSDTPNTVIEGQLLNTGLWDQTIGADAAGATTKVVFNAVEYNLDTNIATGLGTLSVNSDGTWTFQANGNINNNPNPTVTFTVKVTDGDLDVAQDTQVITITDGADPTATKNATVNVDEEGLSTGNATGTNPGANSENGSDTVTFQAGSDNIVSVAFENPLVGLTADVNGIAGDDIVWVRDSDTVIRGEIGGITAITITLTPPALPITTGNSANATVSVVLSDNFPHVNAGGENVINLTGLSVVATDTDGDTASATVAINVTDDVPLNNATTISATVHEDALPGGNAAGEGVKTTTATFTATAIAGLVNPGADSPVTIGFNSGIHGVDTMLDNQNGVSILWHYVDATHLEGRAGTDVVFTLTRNGANYDFELLDAIDHSPLGAGDADTETLSLANVFTATDSDGDAVIINAGASVTIENDVPVNNGATATITVHEDALNNANAVGNNTGEGPKTVNASFTAAAIAALVAAGADGPVALAFNSTTLDGTNTGLTQGGTAIQWDYVDATQVRGLVGGDSTKVVFTLTWDAVNSEYDFVLLDNIDHGTLLDDNGDAYTTSLSLAGVFTATDTDGDSITIDAGASVLIENDIPILGTVQSQQASNNPAQTPAVGTLHLAPGADGVGTITITADLTGITSGGNVLTSVMTSSNVLTAFYDANSSGTFDVGDTEVFTLTVNPADGPSGQYVFDLKAPLDGGIIDTDVGGTTSFGAGPQPYQYVSETDVATDPLALISGWQTNGSFNAATWYAGSNSLPVTGVTLDTVNGSTSGWGVASNTFDLAEFMRFDFGALNDFDGAGPYNPPAPAVPLPQISYATFDLIGYGSGDTVQFVVHHTDGTTVSYTWTSANPDTGYEVTATFGKTIAWIDAYVSTISGGSGKIDLQKVGVQSSVVDETIPFTLTIKDGDGDTTATQPFTVQVKDGLSPLPVAPPVVVDLDGDGAEFVSLAAGITFDYDGDGTAEATAWAGKDDGILAIDLEGDGKITSAAEFVFGSEGMTDLQGIAALYDSNQDGVLDAADARFAEFGVWKGDGSFQSLTDAGIASINLVSDGVSYTAADGDVTVHGTTTYTRTDGTTGTAADATFAVGDAEVMDALLSANAPASGEQTDLTAVQGALAATVDTLTVDTLVDHFAANDDASQPTSEPEDGDLMALLNASIDSTVEASAPPMAMESYDESAALAAAAA